MLWTVSDAVHNWKALVHHLHDYTMTDVRQLSTIEQRVSFAVNYSSSVYAPHNVLYMAEITSVMYMKQLCFQAPRHGR